MGAGSGAVALPPPANVRPPPPPDAYPMPYGPGGAYPPDVLWRGGPSGGVGGTGGLNIRDTLGVVQMVIFIIIVILTAMWLMVSSAEKRIMRNIEATLVKAMLQSSPQAANADT